MYTYAAFWSLTSTPINLAITIFTALTTAQTTTGSILGESSSTGIGIATLILSVINTFFKPYSHLIYHSVANNDTEKNKLIRLTKNWEKVCILKKANDHNYLIDVIFLFSRVFCIRKDIKWLPEASEEYKRERDRENEVINESIV